MSTVHNTHLTTPALVVVSAKEQGKVYELREDGTLTLTEHIIEHPPGYSDNEGFFFRSGDGEQYGSGAPREDDDKRNLERYVKAISGEIQEQMKHHKPKALYVFEPAHLHGQITKRLHMNNVIVETVKEGNFVNHPDTKIASLLEAHGAEQSSDPADPASVVDEENAEEKRKLLEVAKLRGV